ncbi:hypothetical protein ACFQ1L_34700 [Phytohabitans flavus]|nr:hypothetical protein [Phytohabitans flavus]
MEKATCVDGRAPALLSDGRVVGLQPLLRGGTHALWADGDRLASRDWFDNAYRMAESEGDLEAMAWSALGLSGLWLHEHRDTAAAVLLETRLRRALATVAPDSSLGLRLAARLAGEADYRTSQHARILAAVREAGNADDPVARAEAGSMAHQCLLGPEHRETRHALAQDLVADSLLTARRGDLLIGLLWRTVDLFLDADPHAERYLAELKGHLAQDRHLAVGFVVDAIDVMLSIRAGRIEEAETLAATCAERGQAAGDADALGWHGTHLVALRWYQGRIAELLPALRELVNSPTLSARDDSHLAALALAAAATGDQRQASGALAKLGGGDLAGLPRSSTWLLTMYCVAEAAHLLRDGATSATVYDLLRPFAHLPIMAGPGVACFGSAHHALGVASLTSGDAVQAVEHLREAVRHNVVIGHWPAATLSRARLAQALRARARPVDAAEAQRELSVAAQDAAGFGMALPAFEWRAAARAQPRTVSCQRRGSRWMIELGARAAVVDDLLGMSYLAVLLANPGSEIPAIQLAAGPGLLSAAAVDRTASSHQPVLDEQAVRAYKRRLSNLQKEVDGYHARNDIARAARAQEELDWLIAELKANSGLGGRPRTFAKSDELARISVGKAIRRALQRIAIADPAIGRELRDTITTGAQCCYRPNLSR